jgi:hypothetical protein
MRTLSPLGELTQDPDIPVWWVSQPVAVPLLGGQRLPFTVTVEATDDVYPPDVAEAVRNFLALGRDGRAAAAPLVYKNYADFADAVSEVDVEIAGPAAVWDHVQVTEIHVDRRHRRDRDVYVQVSCNCDWEVEHGLQLVYRQGSRLVRVSDQDGHLTHADAYDLPENQDAEPGAAADGGGM